MENFYLIYLPILWIILTVFTFILTIIYEHKIEKIRKMFVVIFIVALLLSIIYPLTLPTFYKVFALVSYIVFFIILFNEKTLRNIFLKNVDIV